MTTSGPRPPRPIRWYGSGFVGGAPSAGALQYEALADVLHRRAAHPDPPPPLPNPQGRDRAHPDPSATAFRRVGDFTPSRLPYTRGHPAVQVLPELGEPHTASS